MNDKGVEKQRRKPVAWIYAVPVLVLLVLAAFFYRGLQLNPRDLDAEMIGQTAPSFSLPRLSNPDETIGTDDFAGELVVLNVWGSWCVGCRQEHGFLMKLAASGVPLYGINWQERDGREAALEWLDRHGDPYLASAMDYVGDVAIDYGVYGAPETFLIGPDLTILAKRVGPLDEEIWERDFVPIIEAHRGGG